MPPARFKAIKTIKTSVLRRRWAVEGDTAAGKRSPVVRLGLPTAVKVLSYPLRAVHALTGVFVGECRFGPESFA